MRWREPASAVSWSAFAAKARDGCTSDNITSKAMDAWIVPKTQFARLASGYWPNLRVRESITTRRRKVISSMYTGKVRIAPPGATGVIFEKWYAADSRTPLTREQMLLRRLRAGNGAIGLLGRLVCRGWRRVWGPRILGSGRFANAGLR